MLVYIKKIYTDVCEWSLRSVARNQFLYLVTKPFTVLISIIYSEMYISVIIYNY
uniref:Uncharacterized protein n=1 Tax=Myoviridae sp. ctJ2i1 TaxID=2825079 RepID=A0A8S5V210_9CAUD|nr:MAG TPA: hypothetical protein [Myoviridae sp. ctJ2i1]